MTLVRIAFRGWLLVAATAANVRFIASGQYAEALLCGGWISWIWWGNAHGAAHNGHRYARLAYAAGAALGTVTGMFLARLI